MKAKHAVSVSFVATVLCVGLVAQAGSFFDLVKTAPVSQIAAAIKAGASVTAKNSDGATPLMLFVAYNPLTEKAKVGFGQPKTVNGVDVFVNAGADVNAVDNDGATPLMYAAQYSKVPRMVSDLLNAGADATKVDSEGSTAYKYLQTNAALKGTDAEMTLQLADTAGAGGFSVYGGSGKTSSKPAAAAQPVKKDATADPSKTVYIDGASIAGNYSGHLYINDDVDNPSQANLVIKEDNTVVLTFPDAKGNKSRPLRNHASRDDKRRVHT